MNRKKYLKGIAILFIIALLILVFVNPSFNSRSNGINLLQNAENRIIINAQSDTNLIKFNRYSDSIRYKIDYEKAKLKGIGQTMYLLATGLATYDECDSCKNLRDFVAFGTQTKYYVTLRNFTLRENSSFYINNGKYLIEKFNVEKENKTSQTGQTVTKEVKVRLGVDHWENKTHLLIPVTKRQYHLLKIMFYVLLPLCIILGIWIFIYMPFKLLTNIAAGRPFVPNNIKYLNIIGWTTIGVTALVVVVPVLVKLLCYRLIPKEIYYPFWGVLLNYKWVIFIGIAILIISNAFKQGMKMKQEQDLTV